jgi:hypothetical protein
VSAEEEKEGKKEKRKEKGPGSNGTTLSSLGTNVLLSKCQQASTFFGSWSSQKWQVLSASLERAWLHTTRPVRQSQLGDTDQFIGLIP